jgi:hypothetical protein
MQDMLLFAHQLYLMAARCMLLALHHQSCSHTNPAPFPFEAKGTY